MKRIFALMLAFAVVFAMAAPASAITTGKIDWSTIYDHVGNIGTTEPTEPEEPEPDIGEAYRAVVITYNYNGGYSVNLGNGGWGFGSSSYETSKTVTESFNPAKDAYHTVISTKPIKFGYTFAGWEYNGEIYKAGSNILIEGPMTLTAVWTK